MITFPQNFPNARVARSAGPYLPQSELFFSGLARAGDEGHLIVHDTKAEGSRLSPLPENGNTLEEIEVDWSRTSRAEDLEAVSELDGRPGQFMAVEGSRYNGRTPHLFLFNYADGKAESLEQFDLSQIPHEIEGMVTQQRPGGRPISDLLLSSQGALWAAGCTDNGDTGPFESLIYRIGRLDVSAANPVTSTLDHAARVPGEKVEELG